jgi:hypothetical protein
LHSADLKMLAQASSALIRPATGSLEEPVHWRSAPYNQVPTLRDDVRRLFEALGVAIPAAVPLDPARAATRQTLPQRRKEK